MKAILALEDGRIFEGRSFGAEGEMAGEVVFNTSMTGYEEILTDPSYYRQIVTMTSPMIGNYGINVEDHESAKPWVSGLIVRENSRIVSNWRAKKSLADFLKEYHVVGIEGVDTRALTKHIRSAGAMKGVVSTIDSDYGRLVEKARHSAGLIGRDLVKEVAPQGGYGWNSNGKYTVAVMDCGVKHNILRELQALNCRVTVLPAGVSYQEIMQLRPDGILLSNGPGDPSAVPYVVEMVQKIMFEQPDLPMMGICLGHQILALALGGRTYKLKFGHRGGNQPVKDLKTGRVAITSQNHGFCVDMSSLNDQEVEVTHVNLNDQTVEGIKHRQHPLFSVQYHPEAAPGPFDAKYLFRNFIEMIRNYKGERNYAETK
ncbi:MAG: glutamine-hydrolyzing carbamoyl-phosphate synthase small subunit [Candidatus Omnitrophota bacterium]